MALKLVDRNGDAVVKGKKYADFRGEHAVVTGWQEPKHAGSTGRVYVRRGKSDAEYYPSVFDMKWINE